jgi:ribosomal protein S18 acetylase RimI-like enzyme
LEDGMREPMTFEIRQAGSSDVNAIAAAHLDSIRSIGPRYYDAETIDDWGSRVRGTLYANAMAAGESFYIALGRIGGKSEVLGFSSHRIDDNEHGTAVYVRGKAARLGIGSALFAVAEASARAAGARSLEIDASLAAFDFYKANGFKEVGRGEHVLSSGRAMACVFMRKELT